MQMVTERLIIRNFAEADWSDVFLYTSDPAVMKYLPEGVMTQEDTQKLVNENLRDDATKFSILLREDNQLIGHIAFFPYFGDHTYEIGWVLNPKYYNCGYATEAAKAFLNYGFQQLNLHRIVATCQPENVPSFKLMEKIGMRREGYFKKCIPHGDVWWDEYAYAILKEEHLSGG
ncbi:GNAT family N-acetyltransferase [Alkalihalobacillus sp. 1P02AB]